MPEEPAKVTKTQLAVAIAQGTSVAKWARATTCPERTAYRWAAEPEVRAAVEACRRRALDRAIGRMAKRATWAADGIVELAKNAESESVRLAALRAVIVRHDGRLQVRGLEERMTEIEEQLQCARLANAESHGLRAGVGTAQAEVTDRSPWDWYAESCPCGLPPGECRVHPRARPTQRPPEGDWRVWAYVAGRGAGKTRAGAAWIQRRVEDGTMKLGCLIAPTAADIRDVMVEGPSGLLAVAPPWMPAAVRVLETPRRMAQRRPRGLPERRGARARRGLEHRHPLGRRAGLLAAQPNRPGTWRCWRCGPAPIPRP